MKKLACIFFVILLLAGLTAAVSAQSGASTARVEATVAADGSARVSVMMTLILDAPQKELAFPIPASATAATVNGSSAHVSTKNGLQQVSLAGVAGIAGTHTVSISYQLPSVVHRLEDKALVELPLLSGFSYPIAQLQFSVRLPGEVKGNPTFASNYHQDTIAEYLQVQLSGAVISGSAQTDMKDHETLTLHLPAEPDMFPQSAAASRVLGLMDWIAIAVAGLAALYYFLTMRSRQKKPEARATVPEGINAGEVEKWLIGGGMDLTMLVIAWAQMGYLRIEVEKSGRVILHKRMEMGNERSVFEGQAYRMLFRDRTRVDGTGSHYARVCREVTQKTARPKEVYHRKSGNPLILQCLSTLSAVLCGAVLGGAYLPHSIGMRIFMGVVIGVLSVGIHYGAEKLLLRRRQDLGIAAACGAVWLVLGLFAGEIVFTLCLVAFQFWSGVAAGYGGRRSGLGRSAALHLQSLRRFMRTAPREELVRLCKSNPEYYYALAPYALAMNVDRILARRLGKLRLPVCPFLTDSRTQRLTANEWNELLRHTVKTLDAKARRLNLERLLRK